MKYDRKIKRIEKTIEEMTGGGNEFRLVFMEPNQTKEEAMAAAGIQEDAPGLTVIICRWVTGDEYQYPGNQKKAENAIDKEIHQLEQELLKDGCTPQEIAEIRVNNTADTGVDALGPQPMKSDLGKLFR
jgi:hypothetical protein